MFKTCGWCGDLLSQGGRHDECANALRDLAVRQEAAARGAAFMAEYLLAQARREARTLEEQVAQDLGLSREEAEELGIL